MPRSLYVLHLSLDCYENTELTELLSHPNLTISFYQLIYAQSDLEPFSDFWPLLWISVSRKDVPHLWIYTDLRLKLTHAAPELVSKCFFSVWLVRSKAEFCGIFPSEFWIGNEWVFIKVGAIFLAGTNMCTSTSVTSNLPGLKSRHLRYLNPEYGRTDPSNYDI